MAEFTGHTAGKGDQVTTPGGKGTVHMVEGEQVTGILHRNGLPFSFHHSRVEVVAKAPQQEQPAAPPAGQFEGHTPGPWHWHEGHDSISPPKGAAGPEERGLYDANNEPVVSGYWRNDGLADCGASNPANAALIAAAPSMLARAEAAEERVRVLEEQVAKLRNTLVYVSDVCPMATDTRERVRTALATTGVQHG